MYACACVRKEFVCKTETKDIANNKNNITIHFNS